MTQQKPADGLSNLSLSETADLIKTGEVSSVEVLEACFAQIDKLEPVHHAFVWQDRESALARARWLDAVRSRARPSEHCMACRWRTRTCITGPDASPACGSQIRSNEPAKTTATALRKLDGAGAIDLGGLAMVEFAMGRTVSTLIFRARATRGATIGCLAAHRAAPA